MAHPCEVGDDHNCEKCPEPCPDERAKQNIKRCYTVLFGSPGDRTLLRISQEFECESDCSSCEFGFRDREP